MLYYTLKTKQETTFVFWDVCLWSDHRLFQSEISKKLLNPVFFKSPDLFPIATRGFQSNVSTIVGCIAIQFGIWYPKYSYYRSKSGSPIKNKMSPT